MTLAQKTTTGIIWNFTELLSRRGLQSVITLLLAWFLSPDDFGLVAMMAVFLAVATNLMESGFKQDLIRIQEASQLDFNTAFYANLGLGLLSYALLFLASPFIADFFNQQRLIALIRIAAVGVLINAFQVVQSAVLSRELNFKAQLQASIPAGIISGIVAVFLAYKGFGVWALIVQMLLAALVTTVLLWLIQGWRPTFGFSRQSLNRMYKFGYKLFLSSLIDTLFQNLYVIVVAKIFTAAIAGYYFFVIKLRDLVITQLVGAIQTVTYPALATIQNDDIRLKAGYRKIIGVTTFLLFPAMLMLAALAEPLFISLLPSKWLPAVSYLQLLCIAGVMYPLHAINLNVLMVKGRSDLFLHVEIIKKIIAVGILCVGVQFGIMGILISQIVTSVLAYIPNSYFSAKLINYPVREQMADFMPALALSGAVALVIYGAGYFIHWPALAKLFIFALVAVTLYLAVAHMLKLQAYQMTRQMLVEQIKQGADKSLLKKPGWCGKCSMNMNYAPIVIPTLCRYEHFKNCITSLAANSLAKETDLYIALDYPLKESHWTGYKKICNYLESLSGFKNIIIIKRENNFGSKGNIDSARKEILKYYDRIISSEDDNIFSPNFLEYINKGLDRFKNDKTVFAICGYTYPVQFEHNENNIMRIQTHFAGWGYGIWKDRYDAFHIDMNYYLRNVSTNRNIVKKIYKYSKKNYYYLAANLGTHSKVGRDVFFSIYMIANGMYTVNPLVSKVKNCGWDGSGINCKVIDYDYSNQEIDAKNSFEIICDDDLSYFEDNTEKLNQFYMPSKTQMLAAHFALIIFLSCGQNMYDWIIRIYNAPKSLYCSCKL